LNYFFTADTHFGHANIIRYCNRPFSSVEEMDVEIIKKWNSKVGKNDTVFHLGDFAFGKTEFDFNKYYNALNGKIVFIKGNHDSLAWANRNKFESFSSGYYEANINGQLIVLSHYAMLVWNKSHYGSYSLFGHSHGTLPDNPNSLSFDCGVDTNNFYPYSFDEVRARMKKKTFIPIDHHGKN